MKIRYLLDEHIASAIQRQLQRRAPALDVLFISANGAPPKGTLDPDLLLWAEQHSFILVTEDRKTMPTHYEQHLNSGRTCVGIFWIRPGTSMGQVVEALYLIWHTCEAEEFINQTLWIPL